MPWRRSSIAPKAVRPSAIRKKKNKRKSRGEYAAAVERKAGKAPADASPRFFNGLLEKPCTNHAYPIKHALKDCGLARRWIGNNAWRGEQKKKQEPEAAADEEKQDDFPGPGGCVMIFGWPLACEWKRKQKVTRQ